MQPSMEERQGSSRSRERDSVTCIIAEHGKKQCRGIAASGREELRINYQAVWLLRAGSSPAGAEEGGGWWWWSPASVARPGCSGIVKPRSCGGDACVTRYPAVSRQSAAARNCIFGTLAMLSGRLTPVAKRLVIP